LAITRASLEDNHPYLLKEFDEVFLPAVGADKQGVFDLFADCVRLNEFGFLMGPCVRELEEAANNSRFTSERASLPRTIKGILDHMLAFQPLLRVPDNDWFYEGPCTSYGFILVSKPPDLRPSVEAYVRRGQARVHKGIQRIYVIGRHEERDFVFKVLRALLSIRELKGVELFSLFRDYRGDPNGVGALIGLDQLLAKLHLTQRPIESLPASGFDTATSHEAELAGGAEEPNTVAQSDLPKTAEDLIVQLSDYDGAWISLAVFGEALRHQVPSFTPQRYGGRNLISVLRKIESLEFDERGAGPAKAVYVRLRPTNQKGDAKTGPARGRVTYEEVAEIVRQHAHEDGWIFLGALGGFLKKRFPDFHHAEFGASSFHELVSRVPELEIQERGEGHSKSYVRVRP
jgi:hypothetical protein